MVTEVRSLALNDYFHGVLLKYVLQGLIDTGHDEVKDIHDAKEVVKLLFLKRREFDKKTGKVKAVVLKTSRLTNKEFIHFIEIIQRWAAEYLGVYIPDPNEKIN